MALKHLQITHVGFSDESNWNQGRFRSLGLVTTSHNQLGILNKDLQKILAESNVSEFKWKKLTGAKERHATKKLIDFAVSQVCGGNLRIDVLIWDIEDSRHKVQRRNDIANLQRMYYHLFRNVLRMRWPNNAVWQLNPDEHTAIEWDTIQDCLVNVSERVEVENNLFTGTKFTYRLQKEFGIRTIKPVNSQQEPLLQLADMFAGLAVFSREKFEEYKQWLQNKSAQLQLFDDSQKQEKISRSSIERFEVLRELNRKCKHHKLGVSLCSSKGLLTHDPAKPLNFWLYEAQDPKDKAPTKK